MQGIPTGENIVIYNLCRSGFKLFGTSLYPVSVCTGSVVDDPPQPYAVLIYATKELHRKQLLTVPTSDAKQRLVTYIKTLPGYGQYYDWYYVATGKEVDEAIYETRKLSGYAYDLPLHK